AHAVGPLAVEHALQAHDAVRLVGADVGVGDRAQRIAVHDWASSSRQKGARRGLGSSRPRALSAERTGAAENDLHQRAATNSRPSWPNTIGVNAMLKRLALLAFA